MKKILIKILILVMGLCSLLAFAGCGHTHDYTELKYSETMHWYKCKCGAVEGINVHKGGTATCTELAECSVCNQKYGKLEDHNYTQLKYNETEHWYECVCGDKKDVENHKGGTATCTEQAECSVCNQKYGKLEDHNYTQLKYNETEHWYGCVCGDKTNVENHKGGTATCTEQAECSVCNQKYGKLEDHNYTQLKYNETEHWYGCVCGDKANIEGHKGGIATCVAKATCETCSAEHGEFDTDNHLFTNYVYNNNPGYGVNGTETATCDRGCGATDTREKADTAIMSVDLGKTVYGKNDATALAINLAEYELETVSSVVVDGQAVAFTYENGIVTIANDVLPNGVVKSGNSMVYAPVEISVDVKGCIFGLSATVADYAIANADEFMTWLEAMAGTTADSKDTLTILLADIDLTGKDFSAPPTAKLKGVFDGQGHTVSNIVMTNCGWIHSAFGITIKNTAFVNLQIERTSGWGSVFFYNGFASFQVAFENCYIQYTAKTAGLKFSWTGGNDAWMEMKNVIIDAAHTGDTTNGVFRQETPRVMENVYVVCSTGNPIGTDASSGASLGTTYASFDALKEVVTDWSAFENECWDLTAGYPVWKINA